MLCAPSFSCFRIFTVFLCVITQTYTHTHTHTPLLLFSLSLFFSLFHHLTHQSNTKNASLNCHQVASTDFCCLHLVYPGQNYTRGKPKTKTLTRTLLITYAIAPSHTLTSSPSVSPLVHLSPYYLFFFDRSPFLHLPTWCADRSTATTGKSNPCP